MRALFISCARVICVLAILAIGAGCDPEAVIKEKVPQSLQKALAFSSSAKKSRAVESSKPQKLTLAIASPANKGVYPLRRPVLFQAKIESGGRRIKQTDLVWTLHSGKAKKEQTIGRGRSFRKEFPPGTHRVTLTLFPAQKDKVVARSSFRVAAGVVGKVIADGRGLAGVNIAVTGTGEKKTVKHYKTERDGTFFFEIPSGEVHKIAPYKKDYSFSPPYVMVQGTSTQDEMIFRGAQGQISDIRLTSAGQEGETLRKVCPGQEAFVKADISSKTPVENLKVHLISAADPKLQPILIGEATYAGGPDGSRNRSGPQVIKVTIPPKSTHGMTTASYKVRVTANSDGASPFAAESSDAITVDIPQCVQKRLAEAIAAQKEGNEEQAVMLYNMIDEMHRSVVDASSMAKQMETNFFDRGLAYLTMALALDPGNLRRRGYLAKAFSDFEQVLKLHTSDVNAFLLKGLVSELRDDYQHALQSYSTVIGIDPRAAEAYALRGKAYLQTRLKKNLARAVDDFTKALTLNPQDEDLRKIRRAALKLDLEHDKEPDEAQVETSSLPIGKIGERLDLKKLRRNWPAQ